MWWERPWEEELRGFRLRFRREWLLGSGTPESSPHHRQDLCSVAPGWEVGGRQRESGVALEAVDSGGLFYKRTQRPREKKLPVTH